MTEELTNIQTQLAAQQQQIADAQQRLTALEAGRGPAAGGDLLGLLTTAAGIASRFARTAAEAHAEQEKPAEEPPRRERPAGGLAAKLAELRADAARVAGEVAEERRDHAHTPPDGAPLVVDRDFAVGDRVRGEDRAPVFPIEDRSGFHTDQVAESRTAPLPEAPVRLWNREHTDHHDAVGRAHGTSSPARGGIITHVAIGGAQADTARVWLHGHALITDGGTAYVAWMDREWTLHGYSTSPWAGLVLDLLPLPKPPRVDEVLGRPPFSGKTTFSGKTAPRAGAPYATPIDLAEGDRIGVEHPDTGKITIHEFSGDPAHPVADEPDPHKAMKRNVRALYNIRDDIAGPAPEAYKLPDGVGLGTVPEYGQPARENDRCTSSFGGHRCIKTLGHDAPHAVAGPGRGAWKVPEDATPDGSGGGGVAFTGPIGTVTSGLIHADRAGADAPECTCLVDDDGYHARDCHITLTAVRRPAPDVDEVLPMPGGPNDRLAQAVTIPRHPDQQDPNTLPAYGDLYARLPYLHDAVNDEDDQ